MGLTKTWHHGDVIAESRIYRTVLLVSSVILLCVLMIGSLLAMQQLKVNHSNDWVTHTYKTMLTGKELDANIQRMIVSERGFLLTRDPTFSASYQIQKNKAVQELADFRLLVHDNPEQLT